MQCEHEIERKRHQSRTQSLLKVLYAIRARKGLGTSFKRSCARSAKPEKMEIQKLLDNLTEEVSCSVCGDIYKEPKQLPCLHSFCLACLNELARTRAVNGNIQCPLCQRQVAVPQSGTFETLPSSFYINSLLDVLAIKQCGTSHVSCGNCATKSQDSSYCFQCSQFWCSGCLNAHNILRANKEHRVVALKDFQARDFEDVFKRPPICKKKHHEKVLEYYCKSCKVGICIVCLNLEHGGHNIEHLEVASEEEKAKILAQVEKAKNNTREYAKKIGKIERELRDVEERVDVVKRQVNSFTEEIILVIRERQRELITEAENTKKTSQDRLTVEKEKIKKIESAINQAENLVQRGASAEVVQSRKHLQEQLEQLVTEELETHPLENNKLAFAENPFLTRSLTTDGIGRLETSHTDCAQSTAEGKGLTEAFTGLEAQFVVTTKNSRGEMCYNPVDRIAVELKRRGGKSPVGNFQVEDKKNGTYQVSYFPVDRGYYDVVVTVNKEDVRGSPFPPIHVKYRKFKPVVSFGKEGIDPGEFQSPWGVAVNEDGEIAVTDLGNNRVQVFTNDGEFLLSFGEKGSDQGQFNNPCGVTYDRDGNFLVVDRGNSRIQQFSRTGQFMRTFGARGELGGKLSRPLGISSCFNGNILVADRDNKHVVVFSPEGRVLLKLNQGGLDPFHCIYHDNRFIVSDGNGSCIKVFSEQGDFLYQFGKRGAGNGEFDRMTGLAIDKSGLLVVCDHGNNRIQLFKLDGTFCCKFRVKRTSSGDFSEPVSVAILRDGKFAVTHWNGHRVQIIQ